MTGTPEVPDLAAIAAEAQLELLAAETIEVSAATPADIEAAFGGDEFGYYEAELHSLHAAAQGALDAVHGNRSVPWMNARRLV